MNSGHYYSITRCWDNGDAFKLNNDAVPQKLLNYQLDIERERAYMLVFNKEPNEQAAVEKEMFQILKEKNNIHCIKVKDRSKTQTKRIAQFTIVTIVVTDNNEHPPYLQRLKRSFFVQFHDHFHPQDGGTDTEASIYI